uniref:Centrosomal protein of 97 kDa n=1 Tax=Anopheles braziliensis TaxID=58242 RepID=A0A2M3Z2C6_9DIPT
MIWCFIISNYHSVLLLFVDLDRTMPPTLILVKKSLKKVPKVEDAQQYRVLILDENELQKIDNIDCYLKIEKLSLSKNQLLRMYGVCRLHCLRELNLSFNGILTIEGLKDLVHLTYLNLECNNIKTIEHLNTNVNLQTLNLAENSITSVSDISSLKKLKELFLNGNRISHLRQCDKYLPTSLETLTLSKNNICDLNEMCTLSHLNNLNSITIADNPCLQMAGNAVGFDYRPFVLNWCMSLKHIDGFIVTAIESLKAEWLYSQGRGRQFRVGEQTALSRYLSSVCPLSGEALENQNERKLRLILSKAQQHQRQLQEQTTQGSDVSNQSVNNSPSSLRRKGQTNRIQSPRVMRLSGRQNSPDAMSNSYHGTLPLNNSLSSGSHNENSGGGSQLFELTRSLIDNITSDENIMSQSLDPNMLAANNGVGITGSAISRLISETVDSNKQQTSSNNDSVLYTDAPSSSLPVLLSDGPLTAASKMVPVPESLMSPDCAPSAASAASIVQRSLQNCNQHTQPQTPQIPKALKMKGGWWIPLLQTIFYHVTVFLSFLDTHRTTDPIVCPFSVTKGGNSRAVNRNNGKEYSSPTLTPRKASSSSGGNGCIPDSRPVSSKTKCFIEPPTPSECDSSNVVSSDEESETVHAEKLQNIRHKIAQQQKLPPHYSIKTNENESGKESIDDGKNKTVENSAIFIQKFWRGYIDRKRVCGVAEKMYHKRTNDHIMQLTKDMQITKHQLETGRKIQQLQMQALRQLWRKVSSINHNGKLTDSCGNRQVSSVSEKDDIAREFTPMVGNSYANGGGSLNDLTKSCSMLMDQVQLLQSAVQDIVGCMQFLIHVPQPSAEQKEQSAQCNIETQTDVIAVHTPQGEHTPFPFPISDVSTRKLNYSKQGTVSMCKLPRPSTLPITETSTKTDLGQKFNDEESISVVYEIVQPQVNVKISEYEECGTIQNITKEKITIADANQGEE